MKLLNYRSLQKISNILYIRYCILYIYHIYRYSQGINCKRGAYSEEGGMYFIKKHKQGEC